MRRIRINTYDLRELARMYYVGQRHVGIGITKAPVDMGDLWLCTVAYELLLARRTIARLRRRK